MYRVFFNLDQVLEITGEEDHFHDLVNTLVRARGGVRDEEIEPMIFDLLQGLEDHLHGLTKSGPIAARDLKPIVNAWIETRRQEVAI